MSESEENALVERVFLRIGSAETDEQLEGALGRFLTPVLLKLDSTEEGVRKKVMELLVHINKRLKSRVKIQLPVDDLLTQYQNPSASSIVTNFTVIYIKMGFPRLTPSQQADRIPLLMSCLEGRSSSHQDSLLQLMMPALEHVQFPHSMEQRRSKFTFVNNPAITKLFLDYVLDLLIVPYGSHTKALELQTQSRRPATAPSGGPATTSPPPAAPPGLSVSAFRRVMGDSPYSPEPLEKVKLGIIKFLGSDMFPEQDVVCHYIIGAADTRHSVATSADMELKKIIGSVDLNNTALLTKLFGIFLGSPTVDMKGQPSLRDEQRRAAACTRIRLKIFPYLLKAREASNSFPYNIQTIFDCLYGENTNVKLKVYAIQLIHQMCLSCTDAKFAAVSPVLQTKMIQLVKEAKEDPKVLSLAYVAVGKLVNRFPQLVSTNITLVQVFFHVMCQVDADMRLAVQEALSLMASAFRDMNESNQKIMEALLMETVDKEEPQVRMMAVQYAERVFAPDNVPSRYILLLAAGDSKEDIRIEALKALKGGNTDKSMSKPEPVVLPKFTDMVQYIKEKADVRVTTPNRYTSANTTLPFNPVAYTEIVQYLRACLAHSAGLEPDMESPNAMRDQAPQIAQYVQKLLAGNGAGKGNCFMGAGPVQIYVGLVQQLLKAVGGASAMYCLLEIVAMATDELVGEFVDKLAWIKALWLSMEKHVRK